MHIVIIIIVAVVVACLFLFVFALLYIPFNKKHINDTQKRKQQTDTQTHKLTALHAPMGEKI